MTHCLTRAALRSTIAAAAVASLVIGTTTAGAATKPVASHLSTYATPSTVRAGSAFSVTGAVSPKGGTVQLERLVGKQWKPLAHAKATSGHYAFSVKSPHKPAVWALRVVRAKTATAKAAIGKTVHVRSTSTVYVVTATASTAAAGQPIAITGSVHPKATGTVLLQVFRHGGWAKNGYARLSANSTFVFNTVQVPGSFSFRVLKPFSAKVAAGTSASFIGTVNPPPLTPGPPTPTPRPPAGPVITTHALPLAVTTKFFATTLTASGGTLPYTWSYSGVPSWLGTSPDGAMGGLPSTPATTSLVVTVKDAAGLTGTATFTLTVVHVSGTGQAWGDDFAGKLSDGGTADESSPVAMKGPAGQTSLTSVIAFAAGGVDTYVLRADGTVWSVGAGTSGALGDGAYADSSSPVQVIGVAGVTAIAAGYNTAYALESNGTVWSWGDNSYGNLGTGANVGNSPTPAQIAAPAAMGAVTAIAAGSTAAYALDTSGTVWAWGNNAHGELGNGTTTPSITPTKVNGFTGMIAIAAGEGDGYEVSATGHVYGWGANESNELHYGDVTGSLNPQLIPGVDGVRQLVAGSKMAYALQGNGDVLAWGVSSSAQMGDGQILSETAPVVVHLPANVTVTSLSAGQSTGYALTSTGTVYSWGAAAHGSLGDGSSTNKVTPTAIPGLANVVALGSGEASTSAFAAVYAAP